MTVKPRRDAAGRVELDCVIPHVDCILDWRGGAAGATSSCREVLDVVLHDGFGVREEVAFLLVCAGGLGDLDGEASKLEEVRRLSDSLLELRAADIWFSSVSIWLGFR
jgi:hypothetical protein